MATGTRNWKFICWQESAPTDFVNRLANSFMKVNLCLHDKDVHEDGTPQKPHWDGVIMLDGPQPYDKLLPILKKIATNEETGTCGINTIQECISTSGALKYITHSGNTDFNESEEKYKYDHKEVISLNGADYLRDILRYQETDQYDEEIIRFIEKENITQYRDLAAYAKFLQPEWYKAVSTRTLYWKGYLTSKEDKQAHSVYTKFDDVIKEIIDGN